MNLSQDSNTILLFNSYTGIACERMDAPLDEVLGRANGYMCMSQNPRRLASKKMRVLVVSRDPEIRRNLAQGLHEAGHQVFDVDNRIDAMRLMYEMQPDLIFLQVAVGLNESLETFAGIRLVTDTPVVLLADQSLSPAFAELRKRNALVLIQPIVIAQAIAKAQVFFRSTRVQARRGQPGKDAALERGLLKAHEILVIDRALEEVGNGGQVRLIMCRGQLRFLAKLKSELLTPESQP
jgi:AmiR/NasT family two-component response regulator